MDGWMIDTNQLPKPTRNPLELVAGEKPAQEEKNPWENNNTSTT